MPLIVGTAIAGNTFSNKATSFFAPLTEWFSTVIQWFVDQRFQLLIMVIGLGITAALMALISWILRRLIPTLMKRTGARLDHALVTRLHLPVMMLLGATGIMISLQAPALPPVIARWLPSCYYAFISLIIFWGLMRFIGFLDFYFKGIAAKTANTMDDLLIDLVRRVVKATICIIAIIFIAQNIFQLNVSALLAGAGVAGLAIAFAAQNALANIFGAATLILDKPFKVGDCVEMGETSGIVEAVGLRSTRLRSLDGTVWYVPNRQMADSTLRNYAQRPNLKYAFDIGLIYGTTPEQMRRALAILHEILDNHPMFDMEEMPPRIYFTELRDWSLNISVIVWFQTQDWFAMQAARQEINLQILERFNAEGLSFAFPSTTNYLTADSAGPVEIKNS